MSARKRRAQRAQRVTCPACGAKPWYACTSVVQGSRRVLKNPHRQRVAAADGVPDPVEITWKDGTAGTITVPTPDEVAARDEWIIEQTEKLRREFGDLTEP